MLPSLTFRTHVDSLVELHHCGVKSSCKSFTFAVIFTKQLQDIDPLRRASHRWMTRLYHSSFLIRSMLILKRTHLYLTISSIFQTNHTKNHSYFMCCSMICATRKYSFDLHDYCWKNFWCNIFILNVFLHLLLIHTDRLNHSRNSST